MPGRVPKTGIDSRSDAERQDDPHHERPHKRSKRNERVEFDAAQEPPNCPGRCDQRNIEERNKSLFGKPLQTNSACAVRQRERVFRVNVHHQRRAQDRAQERNQARQPRVNRRRDPVGQRQIQGEKVPRVPHEQSGHQGKEQPLEAPQPPLPEDQRHQEQVDEGAEAIGDQLRGRKRRELESDVHGATLENAEL